MHEFKRRFPAPPVDWVRPRMAEIADRVTSRNVERNDNVLTISAEHGLISQSEYFSRRVASESVASYFLLHQGDFAYNKSYSKGYPLGAIRRLDRYAKGCVSPLYICFRPNGNAVDSDFLLHYLDGGAIDAGLANIAKEGVRNHGLLNVGIPEFFDLEVPLPPVAEQRVIAEVLDTLDTTIRQTEAIIEKLKQVKQGLLHDLLTRGIDANGELRPPQSEAPELYKESVLGWIPREWEATQIGQLASLQRGHDIVEADFVDGHYPVISSSGVIGYNDKCTSRGPNVVVGRKGSIGRVHYVESDFWAHDTSLFVTNFFGNSVRFVHQLFNYMDLGRFGTKSGSPSLNRNDIHPVYVGRPSLSEQERIVSVVDAHEAVAHKSDLELRKLRTLKSGLMDDLLTGRVRVTPLLP